MTVAPNGNGTARWQLWVSAVGVGSIILGSLFWLNTQIVTLSRETEDLKAQLVAQNLRVERLDTRLQQAQTAIGVMGSDMKEIDTQLRASVDDRNLSHAWDLRIQAMLWEKAFGGKSHLPTDNAVYPNIANGPSR